MTSIVGGVSLPRNLDVVTATVASWHQEWRGLALKPMAGVNWYV